MKQNPVDFRATLPRENKERQVERKMVKDKAKHRQTQFHRSTT